MSCAAPIDTDSWIELAFATAEHTFANCSDWSLYIEGTMYLRWWILCIWYHFVEQDKVTCTALALPERRSKKRLPFLLFQYCLMLFMLCHILLVSWYHIISYHIISYHIISYHIISYHIISYHIISFYRASNLQFFVCRRLQQRMPRQGFLTQRLLQHSKPACKKLNGLQKLCAMRKVCLSSV